MSGGVEMERIAEAGGGVVGDGGGGGVGGVEIVGGDGGGASTKSVLQQLIPAIAKNHNHNRRYYRRLRKQQGGGGGPPGGGRKGGYLHHHGRRIRRNTQAAPNNNNEFLMQEHDHLYHLDFDMNHDEWEGHNNGRGGSDEMETQANVLNSSSEDDQDYLSREFSATYDTVIAERLSSMSKAELISEYQMLQETILELREQVTELEKDKSTLLSQIGSQRSGPSGSGHNNT